MDGMATAIAAQMLSILKRQTIWVLAHPTSRRRFDARPTASGHPQQTTDRAYRSVPGRSPAPRMVYSTMSSMFCQIADGAAPGHVLYRGRHVFAFLALEGHPLIAPLRQIARLEDLDDAPGAELFQVATRVAAALKAETGCHGINLVLSDGKAAGQDVLHVHMHVKPRWEGDDVRLTWDTSAVPDAERRALAESLKRRLRGEV